MTTTFAAPLSPREMEIVQFVAEAWTNPEIAQRLVISPRTVQSHVANAMEKTQTRSRVELAVMAWRQGWV